MSATTNGEAREGSIFAVLCEYAAARDKEFFDAVAAVDEIDARYRAGKGASE